MARLPDSPGHHPLGVMCRIRLGASLLPAGRIGVPVTARGAGGGMW
jgi:hypothetical protein